MAEEKTNVMRLLDQKKVPYIPHYYACPDGAVDGVSVAARIGKDAGAVFKTLVTQGATGKYYVFVVPVLSELALPLVKPGGAFLAMKSVDSDAEIDSARSAIGQLGGKIEKLLDYTVPCTEVRHRVVLIRKVKPTPRQFPRAFARIKKSPLK